MTRIKHEIVGEPSEEVDEYRDGVRIPRASDEGYTDPDDDFDDVEDDSEALDRAMGANKITIEITAKKFTISVWDGENKICEKVMTKSSPNMGRCSDKVDFEDVFSEHSDLVEALEELDSYSFDAAGALWEMAEERGEDLEESDG